MDWRQYQAEAADLFTALGCTAKIEHRVQGSRGSHDIDVWVTREIYGLEHRWAVECKYWATPVTKEKVVALKGIVDDVGADRGILLSNSGFQAGAISMAENSNITLSSLEEFRETARDELTRYTSASLEEKLSVLSFQLHDLLEFEGERRPGYVSGTYKAKFGGPTSEIYSAMGKLSVIDMGFRLKRAGQRRLLLGFEEDGNTPISTNDASEFLEQASRVINECEQVLFEHRALGEGDA